MPYTVFTDDTPHVRIFKFLFTELSFDPLPFCFTFPFPLLQRLEHFWWICALNKTLLSYCYYY